MLFILAISFSSIFFYLAYTLAIHYSLDKFVETGIPIRDAILPKFKLTTLYLVCLMLALMFLIIAIISFDISGFMSESGRFVFLLFVIFPWFVSIGFLIARSKIINNKIIYFNKSENAKDLRVIYLMLLVILIIIKYID